MKGYGIDTNNNGIIFRRWRKWQKYNFEANEVKKCLKQFFNFKKLFNLQNFA